jgi:hypothetical protein
MCYKKKPLIKLLTALINIHFNPIASLDFAVHAILGCDLSVEWPW